MSPTDPPQSKLGKELYALTPEVYRNRDMDHGRSMARYLDTYGELLDRIHQTLEQRLADSFPDNPGGKDALSCQDWLIPYFADLLDVQLVSPHTAGQRNEVANAIGWRQRKGTPVVTEEVAEAIGHQAEDVAEVELQEGFQRIAMTPRIGFPLLPESAFGEDRVDAHNPSEAARHPGLPAVTVDFRRVSRAVQCDASEPTSQVSLFNGEPVVWRQSQPRGAPCFPNRYEDVSPRTLDLRTPDWRRGHFHPRRVLLFAPPPTGFFPTDQVTTEWDLQHESEHVDENITDDVHKIVNSSHGAGDSDSQPMAVTITTSTVDFDEDEDKTYHVEDLNFTGTITVTKGRLVLRKVAAKKIVVTAPTNGNGNIKLDARDCLFDEVEVKHGIVRLEYCTIMKSLNCETLQASDCILMDGEVDDAVSGCVRYSRVPQSLLDLLPHKRNVTTDQPVFFDFITCQSPGGASTFGNPGYGVLHPATPPSICFGAEDNGEMGAYHYRRYCLQNAAILDKLQDFLPLGIEPVLIPDERLLQRPPEASE